MADRKTPAVCAQCGISFMAFEKYARREGGCFCSVGCGSRWRWAKHPHAVSAETRAKQSAAMRGRKASEETRAKMSAWQRGRTRPPETRQRISASLKVSAPRGSNHYAWKGGRRVDPNGYVYVYSPDHPFKGSRGEVAEHRLVAERALGRYLIRKEEVHHVNGDTSDNRNRNLLVCSHAYHKWLHDEMKRQGIDQSQLAGGINA